MSRDFDDDDEGMYSGDRGFLVGRQAALQDWRFRQENKGFDALVNRLRVRKWQRENRDRVNAWHRANNQRPEVKARHARHKRDRRARAHKAAAPLTCARCRVEFQLARVKTGHAPTYCSRDCRLAARRARRAAVKVACPCGKPMTGRRTSCRSCAQRARRAREAT